MVGAPDDYNDKDVRGCYRCRRVHPSRRHYLYTPMPWTNPWYWVLAHLRDRIPHA